MLGVLTRTTCPIGVALGYDSIKLAQLAAHGEEIGVVSYKCVRGAAHDPPDCPQWQRWAINALRYARTNGQFRGKDIIAALPPWGLLLDHINYPTDSQGNPEDAVFAKIKSKMPPGWTRDSIVLRCVPTEQGNALVIAAQRTTIDRHLAVYERVHLRVKSLAVWPIALAKCHARLFNQTAPDRGAVVMLLDIQSDCTNLVVCRGENPLLARSIPMGARQLWGTADASRLAWELVACRKQLLSLYRDVDIERLIFLSAPRVDPEIGRKLGAELGVRVQLADCQVALGIEPAPAPNPDSDPMQTSWALACGLSLC